MTFWCGCPFLLGVAFAVLKVIQTIQYEAHLPGTEESVIDNFFMDELLYCTRRCMKAESSDFVKTSLSLYI